MELREHLRPGMRVLGADQSEYGTVERYDDDAVYVRGRAVPYSAFERADQDHLYVAASGASYFEDDRDTDSLMAASEIRVPLVEERLAVTTRTVDLGNIEVRRTVVNDQVSVPIELRHDHVAVRLVDVEERLATIGERMDAFTEDVIRVPVRGEEVRVSKEAVVTGEVTVGRTERHERLTITDTVRREVVDVTADYDEARAAFRQHFDGTLRDGHGQTFRAHDFADAEPYYRAGFEARRDPRYTHRAFEDVEAEFKARHLSSNPGDEESWSAHSDERRVGWEYGHHPQRSTLPGGAAATRNGDEHDGTR